MLEKGRVYLLVTYGVTLTASMSRNKKGQVEYDGLPAGRKELERAGVDTTALPRSLTIVPGPVR
jgi:hypothetical protein